jgi:hypothetical protein
MLIINSLGASGEESSISWVAALCTILPLVSSGNFLQRSASPDFSAYGTGLA